MRMSPKEQFYMANKTSSSQHYLQSLGNKIKSNQRRIAKQIYNFKSRSRNITFFSKQKSLFKKFQPDTLRSSQKLPQMKKIQKVQKYDDNEKLQLTFNQFFEKQSLNTYRYSERDNDSINKVSRQNSLTKKWNKPINKRQSIRFIQPKSNSMEPKSQHNRTKSISKFFSKESVRKRVESQWQLPKKQQGKQHIRKRILTQSHSSISKNPKKIINFSNSKFEERNTNVSPLMPAFIPIIEMSLEKMTRFIKNLHRIQWIYLFIKDKKNKNKQFSRQFEEHMNKFRIDLDEPINEDAINYMIGRRYELFSKRLGKQDTQNQSNIYQKITSFQNEKDKLLTIQQNKSMLKMYKQRDSLKLSKLKNVKSAKTYQDSEQSSTIYFHLPHTEFISYKLTKASIYQLVSMSHRSFLKLAFILYDKNRNGRVDQNDLMQMINLSKKITSIQEDIKIISQEMILLKQKSFIKKTKDLHLKSRYSTEFMQVNTQSNEKRMSSIKQSEQKQIKQLSESNFQNNKFSLQKLFIFLKERDTTINAETKQEKVEVKQLNFLLFCKAFNNKMPAIIYDLFQYIFGASIRDFKDSSLQNVLKLKNETLQSGLLYEQTNEDKLKRSIIRTNNILLSFLNQSKSLFI